MPTPWRFYMRGAIGRTCSVKISHWYVSFPFFVITIFVPEHSTTDLELLQCHVKFVTVSYRIPRHRGATTWSLVGFRTVTPPRFSQPSLTHSRLYQSVAHSWTHIYFIISSLFLALEYTFIINL